MDWECPAAVAVEFAEASFPFYLQRPRAKYRPAIHGNHRPIRRPTKPTVDGTGLVEPAPVARIYRSLATAPNGAEAQAVRAAVEEMIAEGKAVWADGPGARRAVDARGRVDTSGLAAGSIGLPLRVDVKYRPGVIISAHSGEERTVSLEERGALSEEGVHVETIGVVAGFEPKSKPRSVIGAQIDLNPSQMRLPYAMATPADMRADEEESAERPVWRASTDYKSAFERLPMDDYAARYFHLSVPQPDGTVRLARLTSPGFGVSTTPFTAECVFSVLDEWFQRVHGPFSHRFVDDVHVWAETEREAAERLDTVCVAGSMVGLPVSEAKTTRPTRDGMEYLGVWWALEGISLPGPKRRRAVGWLETLRALPPSVDAARWWRTGLGILGHAASVRRDLWPMAMWLMQGKMAADREEDIPAVAQWAARHALAKDMGETMGSRRVVPYLLVGSDASEDGWGAVVQRGAAGDDWPEGEVYGALGRSAEGLSSMVRELLALWMVVRELCAGGGDGSSDPKLVLWMCDNAGAVYLVNRQFTSNEDAAGLLYAIITSAAESGIEIVAVQVPRALMAHEDALSRLHAAPLPSHAAIRRPSAAQALRDWGDAHGVPREALGQLGGRS